MDVEIDPRNALKLSAWLAYHEPGLFRKILNTTVKLQRSPLGRFGVFGDDAALSEVVVNIPDTSVTPAYSSVDTASFDPSVSLADVTVDTSNLNVSPDTTNAINQAIAALPRSDATAADTSPSFWSSIGSGISSVAGSVAKVAGALVSPQTLAAVGGATAAYFNAQAKSAQAQMQQATVNTQLARVAQGGAPAPITYTRDPVTGALTPVYAGQAGLTPLTPGALNRLSTPAGTIAGLPATWVIGGGLAAGILLLLFSAARR